MKTRYLIITFALISTLLSSCYKSEDINAELGEARYKLDKGTPIDDAISDYYTKYSRFVLYKYEPLDYQWSVKETSKSMRLTPVFNYSLKEDALDDLREAKEVLAEMESKTTKPEDIEKQKEIIKDLGDFIVNYDTAEYQEQRKELEVKCKDTLMMGYNVLKKVFIDLYDDEFKKKYFPFKIFLANTADLDFYKTSKKDLLSFYGQSFIAMGKVRKGINELTGEELNAYKTSINSDFWGGYLQINNKYNIPDAFYKISEKYYKTNLMILPENYGKKVPDVSYYTYGFWEADRAGLGETTRYKFTPSKEQDIEDTMKAILSHSKAELDLAFEGHPLLKEKYDFLIKYFNKQLGFDLTKLAAVDFRD